ncbi:IS1182 family transposase [Virgibacillus doumboii]|uniref:IS1182 family transposase n=1 Tax=Virgibacillus doumboii TaxID=2697503 RepID=UPI0013DF1FA4|nr:IS1182 family transposase [Virgibacillus doumboii]
MEQGEMIPTYFGDLISGDHLARSISDIVEQLDLSEIMNQYTHQGEEAYHPKLLIKILFYGYAEGFFSSRKLGIAVRENIPFRWLAAGQKPDHRTISDFRKNNLKTLAGLFSQIVQIAQELGHISLGHVSIDGSKIKAHASKHKAMSRGRMKKELERLEREITETLEKAQEQDELEMEDEPEDPRHQGIQDRQQRLETIKGALQQLKERKPEASSATPEKDQVNFTDEDSRIMNTKTQGVIQGYNPQIAVDSDNGLIVGYKMSQNSSDQGQFEDVLSSIQENTGTVPEKVTADAGYFSADNIQQAEAYGTDAYIAATKESKQTGNPYDKSNFTYDPDQETYICPIGKKMDLKKIKYKNNEKKPTQWIYECQACPECPFQRECVKAKSKSGKRTMTRTEADPVRESMRTKVQSDEGKAIYKQRKAIVEPVFGQIKECQGFRQFHLRGKDKVEGEFELLALSHNLRKLHTLKHSKKPKVDERKKYVQNQKKAA